MNEKHISQELIAKKITVLSEDVAKLQADVEQRKKFLQAPFPKAR